MSNDILLMVLVFPSENFAMAVAARFLWGLLNGNFGIAKTYLSEVSHIHVQYIIIIISDSSSLILVL